MIYAIIVFGLLISIHEFGHYYAAKKAGVLVQEFAIGMGPKLFKKYSNKTLYTLRLLPVGGYVVLAGEDEQDHLRPGQHIGLELDEQGLVKNIILTAENHPINLTVDSFDLKDDMFIKGYTNQNDEQLTSFQVSDDAEITFEDGSKMAVTPRKTWFKNAKLWQRFTINIAGAFMNFVLAAVLFSMLGFLMPAVSTNENVISAPFANSPAQNAGLKENDKIIAIDNQPTKNFSDIAKNIQNSKNIPDIVLTIDRNGQKIQKEITMEKVQSKGETRYMIGITPISRTDFNNRLTYGWRATINMTNQVLDAVKNLFSHTFSLNKLGGPVAIAKTTAAVSHQGLIALMSFTALISINLAIVNLLPIPGLDGGKIFLNIVEAIIRRPIPEKVEMVITATGVVFLVILFVAVTINDILR